ncbi:phage baseplate assembly protein [Gluconobacter cerinus]|uniref:phage baseplate assembly protein n=1 Tax=Gluconobacter cerinus TaxID=38307 RepID=UPI001B8B0FEC|nr:hypothetical protein [Gluconobacter cerinus]MBS0984567.1 hypothetical protein [Gluconobacter cerinus]MBS0984568.1 hypothetical protein [Gluconobacter cerinus]
MSDTTTVTAKKNYVPKDGNLYVVIESNVFSNFSSFSFSRDIEQVPSTFQMTLPLDNSEFPSGIKDNQEIMIYKNKKQIFHGYMEQFSVYASGNQAHSLTISGRSKLRNLCDPNPEIAGTAINNIQGISDLCKVFTEMYGVGFINKSSSQDKTAWGSVPFNLGDTAFSVISRYARYEGKLLYDNGYGALIVNDVASSVSMTFNSDTQITSSSFSSDLTNRFKDYHVYWQPFTTQSQTGLPPVMKAYDPEPGIWGSAERTKVIINSTSDETGSIAQRLANWEANRQWGRSKQVQITLPNWKDEDQPFYDVNELCVVDLPYLNVHSAEMVICAVNYSYSNEQGSLCTLTLYPKEALSFEPQVLFSSSPALQSLPNSSS